MGKGYDSLEVIYTLLSYNEFKHQMILELKDNSNKALLMEMILRVWYWEVVVLINLPNARFKI